jgi:murein L,D-transpeptidase YafK
MRSVPLARTSKRAVLAALLALGLSGCGKEERSAESTPAGGRPPIDLVLIDKSERRLSLISGRQAVHTYRVALGRDPVGPKVHQGDNRTPEGRYVIDGRNPDSAFHRSLHISYPSSEDRERARRQGVDPGGDIMIHGMGNGLSWIVRLQRRFVDWTRGCVAVTNTEIEEIWDLVPNGTPVEIRP